jgi:hypothetical protein
MHRRFHACPVRGDSAPAATKRSVMNARAYFDLVDAISAATRGAALDSIRDRVSATEMHASERRAIERMMRSRADALSLADATRSRGIAV